MGAADGSNNGLAAIDRPTDVFVVSLIRVHRETLADALDAAEGVRVVGKAATLDEALPQLQRLGGVPVALLDGADLSQVIVALGVPDSQAVAWIEAGVSGSVPPEASLGDVVVALQRVAEGELVASQQVVAQLATRVRGLAAGPEDLTTEERLTVREAEVLELLGEGLSNKQIAQRLSIQVQTVKNHVHRVLKKLDVSRRAEAAARLRRRRG